MTLMDIPWWMIMGAAGPSRTLCDTLEEGSETARHVALFLSMPSDSQSWDNPVVSRFMHHLRGVMPKEVVGILDDGTFRVNIGDNDLGEIAARIRFAVCAVDVEDVITPHLPACRLFLLHSRYPHQPEKTRSGVVVAAFTADHAVAMADQRWEKTWYSPEDITVQHLGVAKDNQPRWVAPMTRPDSR